MDDGSLTLHMPIVVNAEQYKSTMLQFFFAVCPIFFHLGISRHVSGPCHTCFGHVMAANGVCNMLQNPWHMLSGMLCAPWFSQHGRLYVG